MRNGRAAFGSDGKPLESGRVLELSLACQDIDRNRAIIDGRVPIEGCRVNGIIGRPEEIFQRAFRHHEFDISELSLCTHLVTTARGDGPYIAIPAFVSRAFRHSSIYVRAAAGIDRPEALRGRNVGVPDFQQTAGVWARGLLADEHGIDRRDIHWHMGGLDQAGRVARVPLELKNEIRIDPIGHDRTLSQMLETGELDAVIAPRPPTGYGQPGITRLFPDARQAEEAYFKKTRLFPLMHAIGIRRALADRHPWLAVNVYAAFHQARAMAMESLRRMDTPQVAHPWIAEEIGRVKAVMGEDYWPYGIAENRNELAALMRYAEADGLVGEPVPLEDLFAASTFDHFNF
jgi:4,5-dihydroxyphthalate decarboxylase